MAKKKTQKNVRIKPTIIVTLVTGKKLVYILDKNSMSKDEYIAFQELISGDTAQIAFGMRLMEK